MASGGKKQLGMFTGKDKSGKDNVDGSKIDRPNTTTPNSNDMLKKEGGSNGSNNSNDIQKDSDTPTEGNVHKTKKTSKFKK